ncbi:response regulator [Sphingomonas changnyeongensis]|jgi:two-component system chemotaxis response regulator CheY|uniref:Response regulator n=1 Tax=Sphingomonas changnyeongensis TaxID=2698679 RepID=A0A7Z2S6T8_9SPHN|nr:response regulator [Sphingomonas changnyeongensis]QHL89641.1 response regulator [Sphingomonas changnyeongensis]
MPKTILIVDDSATMLMSVRATLEMNGYVVETAADGCKALSKLRSGLKADMIITDINMPHMGGMELIKQVRALPGYRFKPILTLTTESQAAKRDEARRLGATGWLVKPVPGPELLEVVRQVMPG